MTRQKYKYIIGIILALFLTAFSILPFFPAAIAAAEIDQPILGDTIFEAQYSANYKKTFANMNVSVDLQAGDVDGQAFDTTKYPYVPQSKKMEIVNFVEFCYSANVNLQQNYGLFIYIYNQGKQNIDTLALNNTAQLACEYKDGKPSKYEQYKLRFCSVSEDGLMYKFLVEDHKSADGKKIVERVNPEKRRYDVSGVELSIDYSANATEYNVAITYEFSGFAKGMSTSDVSTLKCNVYDLETIEPRVKHTYFRFQGAQNIAQQVNSCYFGIDKKYIEQYEKLQQITAKWYEYKTQPIIITSSNDVYNGLLPWLNVDIGYTNVNVPYHLYTQLPNDQINKGRIDWTYNYNYNSSLAMTKLMYLFNTFGVSIYDYTLPDTVLRDYIYSRNVQNGGLGAGGKVNPALFTGDIDDGHQRGENILTKDADDLFSLLSDATNNPLYKWWLEKCGSKIELADIKDIRPIAEIKDSDLSVTDDVLSRNLLINLADVPAFRQYCADEKAAGRKVHIFRYSVTEYFTKECAVFENKPFSTNQTDIVVRATGSVFLDFDIISLTFANYGDYITIPVVHSPTDIVPDVTPPIPPPTIDTLLDRLREWIVENLTTLIIVVVVVLIAIVGIVFLSRPSQYRRRKK
ncbi:MAG: hypothetical protein RSB20_00690 [Clostridia bacterium]